MLRLAQIESIGGIKASSMMRCESGARNKRTDRSKIDCIFLINKIYHGREQDPKKERKRLIEVHEPPLVYYYDCDFLVPPFRNIML